jgi:hypothetical protein
MSSAAPKGARGGVLRCALIQITEALDGMKRQLIFSSQGAWSSDEQVVGETPAGLPAGPFGFAQGRLALQVQRRYFQKIERPH